MLLEVKALPPVPGALAPPAYAGPKMESKAGNIDTASVYEVVEPTNRSPKKPERVCAFTIWLAPTPPGSCNAVVAVTIAPEGQERRLSRFGYINRGTLPARDGKEGIVAAIVLPHFSYAVSGEVKHHVKNGTPNGATGRAMNKLAEGAALRLRDQRGKRQGRGKERYVNLGSGSG